MILYHFTSKYHVDGCLEHGIKFGMIPEKMGSLVAVIHGYQWLTTNPDFIQSWCEGGSLGYDRTEYRLTVKIPKKKQKNLLIWLDNCHDYKLAGVLNSFGDPENWRLYHGEIPKHWIIETVWKHEGVSDENYNRR